MLTFLYVWRPKAVVCCSVKRLLYSIVAGTLNAITHILAKFSERKKKIPKVKNNISKNGRLYVNCIITRDQKLRAF